MASVLIFKKAHWLKHGLSESSYDTIDAKGWKTVWRQGNHCSFYDPKTDSYKGLAGVKEASFTPDDEFKMWFEKLSGEPYSQSATPVVAVAPNVKPVKAKPAAKKSQPGSNTLMTATEAGQAVQGTSSTYYVYLLSDDCRIAYRTKGNSLSIRVEGFTPTAEAACKQWGVEMGKKADDGRKYGSVHLEGLDQKTRVKTLGSLAASVLTKPPTAVLPATGVL